jgi:hypothetical protein
VQKSVPEKIKDGLGDFTKRMLKVKSPYKNKK